MAGTCEERSSRQHRCNNKSNVRKRRAVGTAQGKNQCPFQTRSGVKQGCPLSPLLFNLVVDEIMREVCTSRRGITWSLTQHLEDLDYADDICLMSHKLSDIQAKANDLSRIASRIGLEINAAKTKAMRFNHVNQGNITINGKHSRIRRQVLLPWHRHHQQRWGG